MMNPAPGFRPSFGLLRSTAGGPREPRGRPRLYTLYRLQQPSAPETNSKSHSLALCVFGTDLSTTHPHINDKYEALTVCPGHVGKHSLSQFLLIAAAWFCCESVRSSVEGKVP
jgi:hypothetical protein